MSPPRASDLARALAVRLRSAGCASPDLDARLLTALAATGDETRYVEIARDPLGPDTAARLEALAARRLAGEPVARILGRREFWSLDFRLSPETLVPRPDTETLVSACLEALGGRRDEALRLLDLGTGSGCLLVSLLHELPRAEGLGTDLSLGALVTARANAVANGVGPRAWFALADWTAAIGGRFDAIVTNPPYIPAEEIEALAPDVARFDPHRALAGGRDGLAAYRVILPELSRLLGPGGVFLAEIGCEQAGGVTEIAVSAGLEAARVVADLEGRDRVVIIRRTG